MYPPGGPQSAPPSPLLRTGSAQSMVAGIQQGAGAVDGEEEISIGPPLPDRTIPGTAEKGNLLSPKASNYDSGTEVGNGQNDPNVSDQHTDDGGPYEDDGSRPRAYSKAKPLGDRENRFTSTLRRLSTVRKRNKTKRQRGADKQKEMGMGGQGGQAAAAVSGSSATQSTICDINQQDDMPMSPGANNITMLPSALESGGAGSSSSVGLGVGPAVSLSMRPSSTTSKESETEVTTSGYLR